MRRQAQPYRKARGRRATGALKAMRRGRPAFLKNPMDTRRAVQKRARRVRSARRIGR